MNGWWVRRVTARPPVEKCNKGRRKPLWAFTKKGKSHHSNFSPRKSHSSYFLPAACFRVLPIWKCIYSLKLQRRYLGATVFSHVWSLFKIVSIVQLNKLFSCWSLTAIHLLSCSPASCITYTILLKFFAFTQNHLCCPAHQIACFLHAELTSPLYNYTPSYWIISWAFLLGNSQ